MRTTTPLARELQTLALDLIVDPAEPSRDAIDEERLGALADDMAANNLLEPIGVLERRAGLEYEVIWGHRRTLAARRLGWLHIEAFVYPAGTDVKQARMAENAFHEQLTPLEEARECQLWLDNGLSKVEIARRRRRTIAWVEGRLAMLAWPDDIRAAVAAGRLGLQVAHELTTVDFGPYRAELIREAQQNGATARVVAAWAAAYHADRERIVSNQITIQEIAQRRHEYIVKSLCEVCGKERPLEEFRTIRMCREEYAELMAQLQAPPTE